MVQRQRFFAAGVSVFVTGACAAGVSTTAGASAAKASLPAPQTGQRSGQSALSHFQPQMEQVHTLAAAACPAVQPEPAPPSRPQRGRARAADQGR